MSKNWKDQLLKSGIPLENDVKKFLQRYKCVLDFDFTYFRNDEHNVVKEFSYDIDASFIKENHFIDFMIECKYRHNSTMWVFIPEKYGGIKEIDYTSFMHPNDYFTDSKHQFDYYFPIQFAPLCSKGVEIISSGSNEVSIKRAINQLSYAFIYKFTSATENHLFESGLENDIFYTIPIIVTTAQLYRIKEDINIERIKPVKEVEEICEEVNALVYQATIGENLYKHNMKVLNDFVKEHGLKRLITKNKSFSDDIDHLFSVIAKNYSPSSILILKYDNNFESMSTLFKYINTLLYPSKRIIRQIEKKKQRIEKEVDEIMKKSEIDK